MMAWSFASGQVDAWILGVAVPLAVSEVSDASRLDVARVTEDEVENTSDGTDEPSASEEPKVPVEEIELDTSADAPDVVKPEVLRTIDEYDTEFALTAAKVWLS